MRFLSGAINDLCLIDTNYNVKNCRYQLVEGSSVTVIDKIDSIPLLVTMAGIAKELWRIKDGASETVVLRLASKSIFVNVVQLRNLVE